ncbi:MAG: rod shape-determining protein MreD [Chloroflexota bacterium]
MNVRSLHPGMLTALWLLPLLAVLQGSLVPHLAPWGALPSIVLIVAVDWGILRGADQGMLWGLYGGLCLDVFSGWPFGTSAVALVVVTSLVSLGSGTFMRTHTLVPIVTVFAATFLYYLIVLFILESVHEPVGWTAMLRDVALPAAIVNAIINIPAFHLMQKLERRLYPAQRASW